MLNRSIRGVEVIPANQAATKPRVGLRDACGGRRAVEVVDMAGAAAKTCSDAGQSDPTGRIGVGIQSSLVVKQLRQTQEPQEQNAWSKCEGRRWCWGSKPGEGRELD